MKVQWIKNKLVNEEGRIVGHYRQAESEGDIVAYVLDIMKGLDRTAGVYIDEERARLAIVRQLDGQLEDGLEWTTLTADLSDGFENEKGLKPRRTFNEMRESLLNRIRIPDEYGNATAEQGDILIAEHNDNVGPDGKVRGTLAVKYNTIPGRSAFRFQPRVLIAGNADGLPFVSTGWSFRRKLQ